MRAACYLATGRGCCGLLSVCFWLGRDIFPILISSACALVISTSVRYWQRPWRRGRALSKSPLGVVVCLCNILGSALASLLRYQTSGEGRLVAIKYVSSPIFSYKRMISLPRHCYA